MSIIYVFFIGVSKWLSNWSNWYELGIGKLDANFADAKPLFFLPQPTVELDDSDSKSEASDELSWQWKNQWSISNQKTVWRCAMWFWVGSWCLYGLTRISSAQGLSWSFHIFPVNGMYGGVEFIKMEGFTRAFRLVDHSSWRENHIMTTVNRLLFNCLAVCCFCQPRKSWHGREPVKLIGTHSLYNINDTRSSFIIFNLIILICLTILDKESGHLSFRSNANISTPTWNVK